MWVTAPGDDEAYETTNEGLYQTAFFDSSNGGATWNVAQAGSQVLSPDTGPLVKVRNSSVVLQVLDMHPGRYVYRYLVASPSVVPQLANVVNSGVASDEALPSATQDTSGNYYLVGDINNATGGLGIQVGRTTDQGMTFTQLPMIPQTATGTSTFTSVAAGKPGHVAVLYYYTAASGLDVTTMNVPWSVQVAETYDAFDAIPIVDGDDARARGAHGRDVRERGLHGRRAIFRAISSPRSSIRTNTSTPHGSTKPNAALTPTIRFARLH